MHIIAPAKNKNLQKVAKEKLMNLIPFTDDDLAANDDGFFSEAQKKISNQKPISISH